MEMRSNAFTMNTRVVIVDQWVDSGGSMKAAIELVERQKGVVSAVVALCFEEGGERTNTAWLRSHYHCATVVEPGSPEQAQCNAHWLSSWGPNPEAG